MPSPKYLLGVSSPKYLLGVPSLGVMQSEPPLVADARPGSVLSTSLSLGL